MQPLTGGTLYINMALPVQPLRQLNCRMDTAFVPYDRNGFRTESAAMPETHKQHHFTGGIP